MSKFKVGDVVVPTTEYGKKKLNGTSLVVSECNKSFVKFNNTHGVWNPDMFKLLKEETMKLELGGKYRKVGTHEPVRVICTDRVSSDVAKEFTCVSLVLRNERFEYMCVTTEEGKDMVGETLFEEVPEVDWSKVPVDTKIWVGKEPRHFAGFSSHTEAVFYYSSGTTSHTSQKVCNGLSTQFSTHKSNCSLDNPNA